MIFKIKKNIFTESEAYAVRSPLGEMMCKIAALNCGYYIFNKAGLQIAQIIFENNEAVLTLASKKVGFPGSIKLTCFAPDKFSISSNQVSAEDLALLQNMKVSKSDNYSIWGKPSIYNFDVYCGSKLAANVIPCETDSEYCQVNTQDSGNFLIIIMIVLASEYLNASLLAGASKKRK